MTYEQLIARVRDLGFADDDEMQEFGELVPNAINQAIEEININLVPIIGTYEFTITGDMYGTYYIDMAEEDPDFLEFMDVPVQYNVTRAYKEDGVIKTVSTPLFERYNNYEIEGDSTLVFFASDLTGIENETKLNGLDADNLALKQATQYTFRIYYKKHHTTFTGASDELAAELELPLRVHHIVPLLVAYYVWLEDEPTKAVQYYNQFEQSANSIVNSQLNKRFRVRVLPGGM